MIVAEKAVVKVKQQDSGSLSTDKSSPSKGLLIIRRILIITIINDITRGRKTVIIL